MALGTGVKINWVEDRLGQNKSGKEEKSGHGHRLDWTGQDREGGGCWGV